MRHPLRENMNDLTMDNRITISQERLNQLYESLYNEFNEKERQDLSSTFGIVFSELPGASEQETLRNFIRVIANRNQMEDLLIECWELRPSIVWKNI